MMMHLNRKKTNVVFSLQDAKPIVVMPQFHVKSIREWFTQVLVLYFSEYSIFDDGSYFGFQSFGDNNFGRNDQLNIHFRFRTHTIIIIPFLIFPACTATSQTSSLAWHTLI